MATSVQVEKPLFYYYVITNDSDQKKVALFRDDNFSIMEEIINDWFFFVRREHAWVGHCLMKRGPQEGLRRQLHRLMVFNVGDAPASLVLHSLKNHFRGSSMNIRVECVLEEDFFTPDNPDIEWVLRKSLYSPSLFVNPTTLGRPLAEKARQLLHVEKMV